MPSKIIFPRNDERIVDTGSRGLPELVSASKWPADRQLLYLARDVIKFKPLMFPCILKGL